MDTRLVVYFDLDGVLADFDGRVEMLTKTKRTLLTTKQLWAAVNKDTEFFRSLEPFESMVTVARHLIELGVDVRVLTATGNEYSVVAPQKMAWVQEHLGLDKHKVVIVKSGTDKAVWATPNSILVDDTPKVINAWREAGGVGILHKDDTTPVSIFEVLEGL